ncbi:YbaB/EbfC family nucleoid-associated protein [Couchioplanes caeruleus]|uniref:YbaB/EbfC family nucleoid-associated protein n=1 Tax=Couchioplanes caeruleus TaxID=56438 RepID=UPI0020BE57A3|nr:YbaB/EbfC family nucleoid-associated protein [Couchioplanes caeruleus]UQU64321.1 YbaB/EbfC family nucleoid-associated protein [Couchioplanes caeruleus]
MFGDESVDSALERIEQWQQSMAQRAEQAQTLAQRTSALTATARSRDDLVTVTVGPEGQLTQLHLDERTRRQSAAATARAIMEALQAAKDALVMKFEAATAETVGADSETGRMLNESLRRRLGMPLESSDEAR